VARKPNQPQRGNDEMKETYTVEYYRGIQFVGESFEQIAGWSNLMMALTIRKRDHIVPSVFGKVKWDNVTIVRWNKDGSKEVIREDMEQF
jgi:hypothetical protein